MAGHSTRRSFLELAGVGLTSAELSRTANGKEQHRNIQDISVSTLNVTSIEKTPRIVTFNGRVTDVPAGTSVTVGFQYSNYNAVWLETPTKEVTSPGTTKFSITERMPYIGHSFPYRAIALSDGSIISKGQMFKVFVPNFIDTIEIDTVDVDVSGTTATVRGRVADFGKAVRLTPGAKVSKNELEPNQSGIGWARSPGAPELSRDGAREFSETYEDLDSGMEYWAQAGTVLPRGPVSTYSAGNVIRFKTDGRTVGNPYPNTLEITKDGIRDGSARYEVTVSGDIEPTASFETGRTGSIEGNTATGWVGPKTGTDAINYSGEIVDFSLDGPARVFRNGTEVDNPGGDSNLKNVLEVAKADTPDGEAIFNVTVSGDIAPTDSFDQNGRDSIQGNTATGVVGPKLGSDAVRYSGTILDFSLEGPAKVFRNGVVVDRNELGKDGHLPNTLRVTKAGMPDGEATYSVTVSGDIAPTDSFDTNGRDAIRGSTVTGVVGPEYGSDAIRYSGRITSFSLEGPAKVFRNGTEIEPPRDDPQLPNTLEITKEGIRDGSAKYVVTVSGDIEPTASFETGRTGSIVGNTATGWVGPKRGSDAIRYSGEIVDFSLDGPARVLRNGTEIDPYGGPGLPNRLEVTKSNTAYGKATFRVTVSGDLEPTDSFDQNGRDSIDGNTATMVVGPEKGTDAIRYSGEILDISLDGPARVLRNGTEIDVSDGGGDSRLPNRLVVTKSNTPDGEATFRVTVSGDIEPTDSFDQNGRDSIDGNTATMAVGPKSGSDAIRYSGNIVDSSLDGPARVLRNGTEIDGPDGGGDSKLPNKLVVTKANNGEPLEGYGMATVTVTVSGDIVPLDNFDQNGRDSIDGNTATMVVGPEKGTDAIRFSGEIVDISQDGPARVFLNGTEI